MTLKLILTNVLLICLISTISLTVYHNCFNKKVGYVEIKKVFNGFQMKKELEEKFRQTADRRKKMIDSLSFNLNLISKQLQEQQNTKEGVNKDLAYQFEYQRQEFLKLKNQYEQDNAALSQKYDGQILERMTQYIIEYGKSNNYEFIFGADGNGSLMYATENKNISEDIISFINSKYKGN